MDASDLDFDALIAGIRNDDHMTYENAYWMLQPYASAFVEQLIALTRAEQDAHIRGKFVELLGDTDSVQVLPVLEEELRHPAREVAQWALTSLEHGLDLPEAKEIARRFRQDRPDWDD